MSINNVFEQECKKLEIPCEDFPFDFALGSRIDFSTLVEGMMWVLKKRQDILCTSCHKTWKAAPKNEA